MTSEELAQIDESLDCFAELADRLAKSAEGTIFGSNVALVTVVTGMVTMLTLQRALLKVAVDIDAKLSKLNVTTV